MIGSLVVAGAGAQVGVEDVYDEVGDYKDAGHEQDHSLHHLVVSSLHGFHRQQAGAGPGEHRFRHYRTGQQEAGHQPEVGEGRSRRTRVVGRLLLASLHIAERAWGLASRGGDGGGFIFGRAGGIGGWVDFDSGC